MKEMKGSRFLLILSMKKQIHAAISLSYGPYKDVLKEETLKSKATGCELFCRSETAARLRMFVKYLNI